MRARRNRRLPRARIAVVPDFRESPLVIWPFRRKPNYVIKIRGRVKVSPTKTSLLRSRLLPPPPSTITAATTKTTTKRTTTTTIPADTSVKSLRRKSHSRAAHGIPCLANSDIKELPPNNSFLRRPRLPPPPSPPLQPFHSRPRRRGGK